MQPLQRSGLGFLTHNPPARLLEHLGDNHIIIERRTLAPQATKAARQWAGRWLVWFQDLVMTYAFYV